MLFIQAASAVWNRADILSVGWLLGATEVGAYGAAARTAFLLTFISTGVNAVSCTFRISPLYENGDLTALQRLSITRATAISALFALVFAIGLVVFSTQLLMIFGEEFIIARSALIILVAAQARRRGQGGL